MISSLLHTPDGVRDIYGNEFRIKRILSNRILKKMHCYGYSDIQTPTFEFFDIFSKDIGTTPAKDLYKFFDKEGNTLVLRPDFTPSIARCAAKYFMEENLPLRFCYEGSSFINTSELQGKLKETTQMGVELISDNTIWGDVEILKLLIEGLLSCGLKDFQVSLGEISYFKGICEEAGLNEEMELSLRKFMSVKNYFGAQEYLNNCGVNSNLIRTFESISKVYMSPADLDNLVSKTNNEKSRNALLRLLQIFSILKENGYEKYISFDLSNLSKYNYYTGITFHAYTYGVGDAIAKGGRYDGLLKKFGKDVPSIGCVFLLDELANAYKRQNLDDECNPEDKVMILFDEQGYMEAMESADMLRKKEKVVLFIHFDEKSRMEDYIKFASENGVSHMIEFRNGGMKESKLNGR